MLRIVRFPEAMSVGTVAMLHRSRSSYIMSPRPARGVARSRAGRLALDVDGRVDPALAVSLLEPNDLEYLRIYRLVDPACGFLARVPSLGRLVLGRNATDDCLEGLRQVRAVHNLVVVGEEFTDAGLQGLAELQSLKTLQVSSPRISDDAVISLIHALPNLEGLQIDGGERITNKLADAIRSEPPRRLTTLSFRYCPEVSESSAMRVAADWPHIRVMWLRDKFLENPHDLAREIPWAVESDGSVVTQPGSTGELL